ncbi:unnamed protein product [Paramecium primaurelia]|uniref:Uncharacterized protein n=1 Tax=Paramecium primaurelia TaxID=5886 RepID=A0A8S1KZW9_PARPR|nr:unnamed protein product [Paramecium primaurelia]
MKTSKIFPQNQISFKQKGYSQIQSNFKEFYAEIQIFFDKMLQNAYLTIKLKQTSCSSINKQISKSPSKLELPASKRDKQTCSLVQNIEKSILSYPKNHVSQGDSELIPLIENSKGFSQIYQIFQLFQFQKQDKKIKILITKNFYYYWIIPQVLQLCEWGASVGKQQDLILINLRKDIKLILEIFNLRQVEFAQKMQQLIERKFTYLLRTLEEHEYTQIQRKIQVFQQKLVIRKLQEHYSFLILLAEIHLKVQTNGQKYKINLIYYNQKLNTSIKVLFCLQTKQSFKNKEKQVKQKLHNLYSSTVWHIWKLKQLMAMAYSKKWNNSQLPH